MEFLIYLISAVICGLIGIWVAFQIRIPTWGPWLTGFLGYSVGAVVGLIIGGIINQSMNGWVGFF